MRDDLLETPKPLSTGPYWPRPWLAFTTASRMLISRGSRTERSAIIVASGELPTQIVDRGSLGIETNGYAGAEIGGERDHQRKSLFGGGDHRPFFAGSGRDDRAETSFASLVSSFSAFMGALPLADSLGSLIILAGGVGS